ncbi:protein-glutamate O-methyltransferase CheR [Desulforhopalus vacuolatus]|uniref:CheR family methyltransferase n=1 Tax=Desulforhopalus vacuolatus TaxID=40414 RepID=UPI0019647481|nr:protein-glutamate O-methyltransferase CheR [Desulforhopalus vacuolatus]MBM9520908.1 protein-glutamate O-methyltransferase CheR [Desulforhopalus vacuolatus]
MMRKNKLINETRSLNELEWLMERVFQKRGFDFREYRRNTLIRRIGRRLKARSSKTYKEYADVLDKDPGEYDKLFNDLTINVTSFFRDQSAFTALEQVVIPALVKKEAKNIRIWSMGCSTGEEPYSIAILLMEFLKQNIKKMDITILATDIDPRALKNAMKGIFSNKAVADIRPSWVEKYFIPAGNNFSVRPELKELITFQTHDMVSDPFYHDFDLVVCRNVLIYFMLPLQIRVLKCIHKELKQGGFLLLGKAEQPAAELNGLFSCVDRNARLYRNIPLQNTGIEWNRKRE